MLEIARGCILNRTYQLIEPLGRGGMGEVWRARHLRLPKDVALKLLTPVAQESAEVVVRFKREAEIASTLGHPHIVEVLDFDRLPDGRPYIVMELLRGQSLRERLAGGAIPLDEALTILLQVAAALQAAHRAGVVHRDLKPENIFLTRRAAASGDELCAKVLDFGISKIQGTQTQLTMEHAVMGTPAYMSPEQAVGHNDQVDGRTDVFALATIGYEMLTGRSPFAGSTLPEVIHKVVYGETRPLAEAAPSLPSRVTRAIDRGMCKDPRHRFPAMSAFSSAISGGDGELDAGSTLAGQGPASAALGPTLAPDSGKTAPAAIATGATLAADSLAANSRSGAAGAVPEKSGSAGGRRWLWGAALILALGAGALVGRSLLREGGAPSATGPLHADAALLERRAPAAPAAPDSRARPEPNRDGSAHDRSPASARGTDGGRRKPGRAQPEELSLLGSEAGLADLPPEVADDLKRARMAVLRCDWSTALPLTERSSRLQDTPQARALEAMAYCCKRDLGGAQGALRNVRGRWHRAAVRFCRERGFLVGD